MLSLIYMEDKAACPLPSDYGNGHFWYLEALDLLFVTLCSSISFNCNQYPVVIHVLLLFKNFWIVSKRSV